MNPHNLPRRFRNTRSFIAIPSSGGGITPSLTSISGGLTGTGAAQNITGTVTNGLWTTSAGGVLTFNVAGTFTLESTIGLVPLALTNFFVRSNSATGGLTCSWSDTSSYFAYNTSGFNNWSFTDRIVATVGGTLQFALQNTATRPISFTLNIVRVS